MKNDGREFDHRTLEVFRFRAIECLQAGESPELIARILGLHVSTIYKWRRLFESGGWKILQAKVISGRPHTFDSKDEEWLKNFLESNNPQDLGFTVALWTRPIVKEVIEEYLGVHLSNTSVGKLLRRMGLSPQRPLSRAYEQNPEAVEQWIAEDFPAIRKRAQEENAKVFFGDESGIRSDYHSGTTWAPVGETPVVPSTGKYYRWNMISAISSEGEMRFFLRDAKEGNVNSSIFIEFLEKLLVGATSKIFLVLDNATIHHSRETRDYVCSVSDRLELFFLPPYAPELNPDELVWNQVKNHTIGKQSFRTKKSLRDALLDTFESLSQMPEKIRSFFQKDSTKYILAEA
jgi:transposase